jgi:hypothetical protein
LTIFTVDSAAAPIGTIWSSSPCWTSVGLSNFFRSSLKSLSEKARMLSSRPLRPPFMPCRQSRRGRLRRPLCAVAVIAVEGHRQVLEELRAVVEGALADAVEDVDRQAARIGFGLEHQRRNGADQRDLGDAAVP